MKLKAWPTGWPDLTNVEATTDETRSLVVQIRKEAYSRHMNYRAVPPFDHFDFAPNTFSCLLVGGQTPHRSANAFGTIRLSVRGLEQDPLSTPCSHIFGSEVRRLFVYNRFLELSRLAIAPSNCYEDGLRMYLALMQNGARAAEAYECDFILAPTVVEHTRLYLGMGFEQVTEARQYHDGIFCCLLALDWRAKRAALRNHKRFCRLFADWSQRELVA